MFTVFNENMFAELFPTSLGITLEKVKRHAALVLGNVCQTDAHRATAGIEGAVEGLFALCDTNDGVVRANALWALGNLAWDPHNQAKSLNFEPISC